MVNISHTSPHIYCEGNRSADNLANIETENRLDFNWYDILLSIISLYFFFLNRYQLQDFICIAFFFGRVVVYVSLVWFSNVFYMCFFPSLIHLSM